MNLAPPWGAAEPYPPHKATTNKAPVSLLFMSPAYIDTISNR